LLYSDMPKKCSYFTLSHFWKFLFFWIALTTQHFDRCFGMLFQLWMKPKILHYTWGLSRDSFRSLFYIIFIKKDPHIYDLLYPFYCLMLLNITNKCIKKYCTVYLFNLKAHIKIVYYALFIENVSFWTSQTFKEFGV
jgi:hypothetical protein